MKNFAIAVLLIATIGIMGCGSESADTSVEKEVAEHTCSDACTNGTHKCGEHCKCGDGCQCAKGATCSAKCDIKEEG